ncbi:aminopeptidase y [Trichoderma cornu-damae]|uniref:Peptide hydrolase n=1 Tax=Trichoderma cornu-damae TaxID=654480 RepID=A0A9P8QIF0_9HYPO|nr:aminopeptidase y [Trichoderma cornu-damae]
MDADGADLTCHSLRNVLWNLNHIADVNGGNRAFGLPGYNASIDFILERVATRFGNELDTYVQPFNHTFETTRRISVRGPKGEDVYAITLQYNTATPLPGGITGQLIDTPVDDTRGSGCFEDQWSGIDATGKIALVKRGVCAIADKLKLAKAHGALAVILYNNQPGKPIGSATLSASNIGLLVPVGVITLEDGSAWKARLVAGETLSATLVVDSVNELRQSWNIISETKQGDPNNVILLGAHLDSVQAGAGVNDDGSGTAALLELATSFRRYGGLKNKVRFAWWGAEESGLIGSLYYGQHLSEKEADRIRFYFNYDMIGSKQPIYAVYADTEAHKTGGSILYDYLLAKGKPVYYGGFGSSSDYVAFLELGIPSSGLFTGAGAPEDACYHQACDNLDNINWEAITLNTKAAGRAAAQLALSLDGIPPREKTSINPSSKRAVQRQLNRAAQLTKVIEKSHSCGGLGDNTI